MALPQAERRITFPEPPAYFAEALEDAELLLKYAAERGIAVEDDTRDHVLEARAASSSGWDEETAANLLTALGKLAAQLKPVTAESLKAWATKPAVRKYWIVATCLAIFIVPFSVASFVTSAISTTIKADIAAANDLTVRLRAELGPAPQTTGQAAADASSTVSSNPAGTARVGDTAVITELQQFASYIREIDSESRLLRLLVLGPGVDYYASKRNNNKEIHDTFQLPDGLPDFALAAGKQTTVYQNVRYFGQSLVDDVQVMYGAISTCLLPVLYALLGTCAYLLRTFELQISARTYTPSVADAPRFLIAGIGGAVVGLFNNFAIGQGVSIPPLAIAFLVGYAVDVFFAFLEGMVQKFTTKAAAAETPPSGNGAKA